MSVCYLCEQPLSAEIRSKEHILLNSIGGRLKSYDLLCRDCNSKLGHEADAELASQLEFLAAYLQIRREKGRIPIVKGGKTPDGRVYNLLNGRNPQISKPEVNKQLDDNLTMYSITARDEKEIAGIIKNIKEKHEKLNMKLTVETVETKEYYLQGTLQFKSSIGGGLAFRSIVKSAVNYYIYKTNDRTEVKHLFDYLLGKDEFKIAKHYYPKKEVYTQVPNEVSHLIYVKADADRKLLYCYIELFSSYSFLVLLSDKYSGESISFTYCYDIIANKVLEKNVTLDVSKEELVENNAMLKDDFQTLSRRLERVISIGEKNQIKAEIEDIIIRSRDKILKRYPNAPFVNSQMTNAFLSEVASQYINFMRD